MEFSALTSSLSRLWEMVEKSGISPGAELRATTGPTGEPPQDLVREFERAMEAQPSVTESQRMPSETVVAENNAPVVAPVVAPEPERKAASKHRKAAEPAPAEAQPVAEVAAPAEAEAPAAPATELPGFSPEDMELLSSAPKKRTHRGGRRRGSNGIG